MEDDLWVTPGLVNEWLYVWQHDLGSTMSFLGQVKQSWAWCIHEAAHADAEKASLLGLADGAG